MVGSGMASFSLDDFSEHPRAVLGPRLTAAAIQGFETGLISNLAYRFWKEDFAEKRVVQLVLFFVSVLSYMQTALSFYSAYYSFVTKFADWSNVFLMKWTSKAHLLVIFLMSMPTKALFIWRCYKLAKRSYRRYILILHSVLYIGEIMSWVLVSIKLFANEFDRHVANDAVVICSFALPFALNIGLSCTLMILILPSRPRIITRSITTTVYRFSFIIWETTLPSTLCSLLSLILYLTVVSKGFWADMFQDIVGQMYIISLFVVLMGMQLPPDGRAQNRTELSLTSLSMTWRRADTPSVAYAPGFELQSLSTSLRSGLPSIDFGSHPDDSRQAQPGSSFVPDSNRRVDGKRSGESERRRALTLNQMGYWK